MEDLNTTSTTTITKIISKIIKMPQEMNKSSQDEIIKKISKIIQYKTVKNAQKIEKIDELLIKNAIKQPLKENRQNYIFEKVGNFFKQIQISPKTRILDIGGGNGNFLSYLGKTYNIPKHNLYCLEESRGKYDNEAFNYNYDNDNINYIFWDDDVKNEVIDADAITDKIGKFDIIICMVVLHHIPENILLSNVMPFIKKHISPNGYILLKEHDARSLQTINYINWEHHLYYILEHPNKHMTLKDINNYLNGFVANYKKMEYFIDLFKDNGFKLKKTFTNIFEPTTVNFKNTTPTKLYWQLFQYHQ